MKKLIKTYICASVNESDKTVHIKHAGAKKDSVILMAVLAERLANDLDIDIEEIVNAIRLLYYTDRDNSFEE